MNELMNKKYIPCFTIAASTLFLAYLFELLRILAFIVFPELDLFFIQI